MKLLRSRPAATRDHAVLRQIAGWCLQYPDEAVLGKVGLLRACLDEITGPGHDELSRTVAYLENGDPRELASHYIEVFDRKPRRTLHLSWFLDGDTRRRGETLAALRRFYRTHGFAPAENELPDFLPVILEFAAAAGSDAAGQVLARFHPALDLLHRNLSTMDTPYRDAVTAVLATLPATPAPLPAEPPAELVGLDPFPTGAGGGR
ncbi:nitrate reductase molybdenum cofactor assembly chaperone [Amycolatopsis azurea]|uniref:Nitrate reductase molybdenum cofactor assembly chaperone n=1 Tax=Amycolatopsis azurea DSM 43854 TaxID=1238180 RepID=M2PN38_9PSEU|nr:nitrate reductase molybdenum cofactor assembly chaperone [Amycolatopsis azurea]EMD25928.1 Respiratory nitrate reductase delta chain [Amycolatopsis azurea DSM 43854]OOC05800.1 nitrate reductase molybdenum cofactor assembly chaperone [Amycolatopsis azurea DSM 43854]